MLKIQTGNIGKNIKRFCLKNTTSANYRKYRGRAEIFSLLTAAQMTRFPHWGIPDVGITSMFGTLALINIGETFKTFMALIPIKARAKAIRKISKQKFSING